LVISAQDNTSKMTNSQYYAAQINKLLKITEKIKNAAAKKRQHLMIFMQIC